MEDEMALLTGPFVVANPRGIPQGVRILHDGTQDWLEGDAIKAADLPAEAFADFVARGFIVKKTTTRKAPDA